MNRPVRILFYYDSKAFFRKWTVVVAIYVLLIFVTLRMMERNLNISSKALLFLILFGGGCLFMLLVWRSRLMWEVIRMPGNCVASIEVDSQALRVIKANDADLPFPRERHSFAILVFQERGVDLFCLEIAYAYHTPQYFFLGRDKKNASTLLHALGLRRFEARFPVHTATGGWDAIPKRLNALHFGEDYSKEMQERGQIQTPSRNKPVSKNYSQKKKERLQFKKPLELRPVRGIYSKKIKALCTRPGHAVLSKNNIKNAVTQCAQKENEPLFARLLDRNGVKTTDPNLAHCFVCVTEQDLTITRQNGESWSLNYTGSSFQLKRTGGEWRWRRLSIVLVMINADNWDDEVAVEYFYGDKPQKDLDELLHALVQAADKGLEKKEAAQALRDQDRDVEDDGKNFAPVFT